jgi:hypothetical protein
MYNSGLRERVFGGEDFGPRNYLVGGFVNEDLWVTQWVQVAADQRAVKYHSQRRQTAGNSLFISGKLAPSYPRNPAEQSVAAQKMLTQNTSRVN